MKPAAATYSTVTVRKNATAAVMEYPLLTGAVAMSHVREQAPPVHLTPRQQEVLLLLWEGLPNKLICRRLNISTGTVKVHISGILRELGVTSRLQAVVSARRWGLVGELAASPSQPAAGSARFAAAA